MNGQMSIFDITMPMISIENKIRLIELFAGYGSQAMALEVIGADYEHYKVVEFDKYAVQSYNAVHNTNYEPTDIRNVHGKDLEIIETERYTYLLTYSFPCTDLSVAGKMQGMKKGSGTRSGLLWEVERIMTEIYESGGELPQVLFMENVPQVISAANINDFHLWQDFLTSLGYTSHVDTLNAKDYGVAQNRERCFMFSFLGEYNYRFPESIPLTKTMKDYLEDEVDEKYYINSEKANKLIAQLIKNKEINFENGNNPCKLDKPYIDGKFTSMNGDISFRDIGTETAGTITARYYKGIGSNGDNAVIVNQIGNIADENNFENPQTGRVYATDGCAPTLNTCSGGGHEPKICVDLSIKNPTENNIANCITSRENRGISNQQSVGNGVIVAMRGRNPDNPSDRTTGSPTEQRLEPNSQGLCNTITSVQKDNMLLIKQATKDGYIKCKVGGVADLSFPSSKTRRGRVQENGEISPTITATETGICRIESLYRIRKLTPRECGRLMAVSDENISKILSVVSNSQAYKQFGNSIVVNCMVAMFSNLNIQGLPRWEEIKERGKKQNAKFKKI